MTRSAIVPTLLATVSLGLGVYQYTEIAGLHARVAQLAGELTKPKAGPASFELRLRALEARARHQASEPPTPSSTAAAEPAPEAVADRSGGQPAPRRGAPSPADQPVAHEISKKVLESVRAGSLDLAANRRTWIEKLATAEGLSPDKTARLGGVFEAEFERRAEVIAEVKEGTRTRQDGRAELQRVEAASNERARAVLGAALFEKYLAHRVASGIHDDGSVN